MRDFEDDASTVGWDRRSFLELLALTGLVSQNTSAPAVCYAAQKKSAATPAPTVEFGDAGSIYSAIKVLANAGHYPLSIVETDYSGFDSYRQTARKKIFELFHYTPPAVSAAAETVGRWETSEYVQEKVLFSTTPWFRVPAYVLTPKGRAGPRPAIVDLHSHGGMFVYGKEKVMPMPEGDPPAIARYRQHNYEGRSTSVELCRRGYVVISTDCFYFGERRTMFPDDIAKHGWDRSKYSLDVVDYLNHRSSQGEGTLACSLFWAGTTWQGIAHWDDIRTVDYLASRPEVDPGRIGCLGISMGGDRTDYLAGLDDRIQCAVSVGWMSTLRPMIKSHVETHSFIHFLPGLAHFLDLPDVIGCMAPKPLMVQQCSRDQLYPLEGMKASVDKITAIYAKAGASSNFEGRFYDHPHIFSRTMQNDAFNWLDRWLKP